MAALYDGDDNRVFTASRKEGKNTYQLFQRKPKESKSGRKSPYTAPSGEENSLFWYGFSQNVLQALSTLPQTIGSIWHSIFDDVSRAYHQKVAKDRATKEGIVVNPPELGNLPGQGEVTYASQVQDVLIPYTTREDTYNYYEERNYVNDVNREHTEVLETYGHDGKARETYSYGKGRASYLNNQTGDSYNYLTNQSGSVTGLTKDGQAVASSSYNLYGARKTSTDTTGNPFAYNGEARDDTGLDYLRARYYDSQGGTFLTEDSYPGEDTDPLSQNRYGYVQNNPVNYTDPSGHFWNSIKKGWNYVKKTASNAWNGVKRVASNTWNTVKRVASNTWNGVKSFASKAWNVTKSAYNHATNWVSTQYNRAVNWGSRQWNKVQTAYNSASDYVQHQYQLAAAQIEARRQQVVRSAYALATGIKSSPSIREGLNLYRNWNTALENTLKHVCDPKTTGASDKGENKANSVDDYSVSAYEFKQNLKKQYDFDEETSELLWKLYKNIEKTEGGNADYVYNRLVGGIIYNDENAQWNGSVLGYLKDIVKWNGTAGPGSTGGAKPHHTIEEQMNRFGLFGEEYKLIQAGIDAQHRRANTEGETVTDFAHQSITTATNLYDNKWRFANFIGLREGHLWNSHQHTNDLSGWLGDVTIGNPPSMNIPDYKADLDAVNIISIMKNRRISYVVATNQYYDQLSTNSYSRESEFLKNVGGMNYVKEQIYKEVGINHQDDAQAMEMLKEKNNVAYQFIQDLSKEKGK